MKQRQPATPGCGDVSINSDGGALDDYLTRAVFRTPKKGEKFCGTSRGVTAIVALDSSEWGDPSLVDDRGSSFLGKQCARRSVPGLIGQHDARIQTAACHPCRIDSCRAEHSYPLRDPGEFCRECESEAADVDLDGAELHVRQASQRVAGELRFTAPKTRHSRRTIPLPVLAVDGLHEHRARQAAERLSAARRGGTRGSCSSWRTARRSSRVTSTGTGTGPGTAPGWPGFGCTTYGTPA